MAAPVTEGYPQHIAIIMDGNGRWAKAKGLARTLGHRQGAETLRSTMRACQELGVKYLTVYAFSSENWQRPEDEVSELMRLLAFYLQGEVKTLRENDIRLKIIGDRSRLSDAVKKQIDKAEENTAHCQSFQLTVCLSYGARQELIHAIQDIARDVANGAVKPDAIDEAMLESRLYTYELPVPDLLIRTGGEHRLSNFLLWQSAYTELYFTDTLWPDFTREHLQEACEDFAKRERRYGRTSDQK
ncbi:MAG: isoprenyl transferase [Rickettsiales bacterium]